ncbi:hypothetical protein KJ688_14490, partial [bacterium]|nr:hypothetical protein [bacterium]
MRFIGILGIITLLGIAFLMSNNRKKINLRTVIWGITLQLLFAAIILGAPLLSYFAMLLFVDLIILYLFNDEIISGAVRENQYLTAGIIILSTFLAGVVFYFLNNLNILTIVWWALLLIIIIKAALKISRYQKYLVA